MQLAVTTVFYKKSYIFQLLHAEVSMDGLAAVLSCFQTLKLFLQKP